MSIIARRFAIFTLIVAVFAVGFSAIVAHPSRKDLRVYSSMDISCTVSPACAATT